MTELGKQLADQIERINGHLPRIEQAFESLEKACQDWRELYWESQQDEMLRLRDIARRLRGGANVLEVATWLEISADNIDLSRIENGVGY